MSPSAAAETPKRLFARAEPIRLDPARTAVVVADMQNAYSTEGGYGDLAGFDIAGARDAISIAKTTRPRRARS